MTVEIRRVSDGVVPEPLEDVFDETMTRERLSARAKVDGHLLVIAVAEGRTVGQCAGTVQHLAQKDPEVNIENLGVDPSYQRRGIAKALIQEVMAWAGELGCDEAWIATEVDNDAANATYRSLGSTQAPAYIHVIAIPQPD